MNNNKKIKYLLCILLVISGVLIGNLYSKEILTKPKKIETTNNTTAGWTVTFDKNGAKTISKSKISCPSKATCNVTLPRIIRSGYTILGWATSSTAKKAQYKVGTTISITKNTKLYAITSKKLKATFNLNGAKKVGAASATCTLYNKTSSCSVTTPSITAASGFKVLGWAKEAKSTKATIKIDKPLKLKENISLYAVTRSTKGCKITFEKNNATNLSYYQKTYYKYNGSKYCTITDVPYIYKEGYEICGFFQTSIENLINKQIAGDSTYWAYPCLERRKKPLTIATTYMVDNIAVDVEKNSEVYYNVYSQYLEYLNQIKPIMPYLFHTKGKISIISEDTYNDIWKGSDTAGMSYGYDGFINMDINIPSSKFITHYTLGTFVHELAHAWDNHFYVKTGKRISEQSDIINVYNKYKEQKSGKRPLRDYSYTNEREFVADTVSFYFWEIYTNGDVKQIYKAHNGNNMNDEIKKTIEKYIKFANDGYIKK